MARRNSVLMEDCYDNDMEHMKLFSPGGTFSSGPEVLDVGGKLFWQ